MGEQPGPNPRAEIENVRRRDPRVRDPADSQQLAQMSGVSKVSLRAPLLALQRARFGRLRQMHLSTDTLEFRNDDPPAGRCLQRDFKTALAERLQERADTSPVRRRDPRARDLTGDGVDPLRRDLRPVLIKAPSRMA